MASVELAKLGTPAVPELLQPLAENWMMARRAALTFARMGPEARSAIPALCLRFHRTQQSPEVGGAELASKILFALGEIGPDARAASLPLVIGLQSPQLHETASIAIAKVGPGMMPEVVAILTGDDDATSVRAAATLARMGTPGIEKLLEAMNDDRLRSLIFRAAPAAGLAPLEPLIERVCSGIDCEDAILLFLQLAETPRGDHNSRVRGDPIGRSPCDSPQWAPLLPRLMEMTRNEDARVRMASIRLLTEAGISLGDGSNHPWRCPDQAAYRELAKEILACFAARREDECPRVRAAAWNGICSHGPRHDGRVR